MNEKFALDSHFKEFEVLNKQILERSKVQQRLLYIISSMSVGLIAFFGSDLFNADYLSSFNPLFLLSVLLITFPFYAISILYSYMDNMIGITVGYIRYHLRDRVCEISGSREIWVGEDYFKHFRSGFIREGLGWVGSYGILMFTPVLLLSTGLYYFISFRNRIDGFLYIFSLFLIIVNFLFLTVSVINSIYGTEIPSKKDSEGWREEHIRERLSSE